MEIITKSDPYEAVLADLRAQRERINIAISTLEAIRSGKPMPRTDTSLVVGTGGMIAGGGGGKVVPAEGAGNRPDLGPGAFLGMSIPEATKKLLATKRQQMKTVDILKELEAGGLVLTSADKLNTVGSILLRRFYAVGDIVRVDRGIWGLQEWYPGRKFAQGKRKGEGDAEEEAEQEETGEGNLTGTLSSTAAGSASNAATLAAQSASSAAGSASAAAARSGGIEHERALPAWLHRGVRQAHGRRRAEVR